MRIKRGVTKKQKHKKVLKQAKGYRLTYSKLYRRAKQALLHAGAYNAMHRKHRAGQFRKEWIKTISAGLAGTGLSYNQFVSGLKKNNVELDRKVLAQIVVNRPEHFSKIIEVVSK